MGSILIVIVSCLVIGYLFLTCYGLILKKKGQDAFVEADLIKKGGKYVKSLDGRIIEYFVYGKLSDYESVVVNMHGSGLEAKYESDFYSPVCEGLNIKGISISMPGCGFSDVQPGRVVYDWAKDDLEIVLDAENVNEFMITGYSQGTVHAMAAAKYFKKRCIGLGLYAPFIPKCELKNTKTKNVIGDGYVPYTKTLNKIYGAFYFAVIHLSLSVFVKQSGKAAIKKIGKSIDINSSLAKRFTDAMQRSVVRGSIGASYESTQDVAFEFGFDLLSIKNDNVVIWHAKNDSECPIEHGYLLKEAFEINSKREVIFKSDEEGYGHLTYSQEKYRVPESSLIFELIKNVKK